MLLIIPLFLKRIRMEEEMLIGEFGPDYVAYMETTKRLIPFVY
jgi:protein-S-isoprenylcysteine O-methyltransferase Ste14